MAPSLGGRGPGGGSGAPGVCGGGSVFWGPSAAHPLSGGHVWAGPPPGGALAVAVLSGANPEACGASRESSTGQAPQRDGDAFGRCSLGCSRGSSAALRSAPSRLPS